MKYKFKFENEKYLFDNKRSIKGDEDKRLLQMAM